MFDLSLYITDAMKRGIKYHFLHINICFFFACLNLKHAGSSQENPILLHANNKVADQTAHIAQSGQRLFCIRSMEV